MSGKGDDLVDGGRLGVAEAVHRIFCIGGDVVEVMAAVHRQESAFPASALAVQAGCGTGTGQQDCPESLYNRRILLPGQCALRRQHRIALW